MQPPSFGKGAFTIRRDSAARIGRIGPDAALRPPRAGSLSVHLSRLCDDPACKGSASVVWRVWSDVSLYAQIRAFIEQLVHVSARRDPLTAARHRAFIAPRMIGGLAALTALPAHLAINGVPGPLEVFIYAWFAAPLVIACYLSRTGRYERAQIMSSAALAVLVATIGAATGGVTSFAAVWLVIIPVEAARAASRRAVIVASVFALCGAAFLFAGQFAQPVAAPSTALMLLGLGSGTLDSG